MEKRCSVHNILKLLVLIYLTFRVEASDTAAYNCVRPDYHPSNNTIYKSFHHYAANIVNNGTRVKIHYVREGPRDGVTVVLIHGYPQRWYEWRHLIPQLVKAGYQVVAFDTRGLGESSIPDEGYDGLSCNRSASCATIAEYHQKCACCRT
ncbi:hypothetical protein K7432_014165 [Basidiobolus ranarum]|uniref:AB hydrolase-1 domain-containing protein n=1 Tax=Basidiobolus ranarum TaxID=34480 RepID=A0ABR2WI31_9FUNG